MTRRGFLLGCMASAVTPAKVPHPLLLDATIRYQRTVATEIFYVGLNQRAKYRWVAAPGNIAKIARWTARNA